jgi:hypothetical protein
VKSATQQRDAVAAIAAQDPQRALELARSIKDPWFRCQALAMAAVHVQDRKIREQVVDEAFAAANELSDPNPIVTVSSWPLKALVLTGNPARVSAAVDRLLEIISTEGSPVRRADALRYLLGAVSSSGNDIMQRVARAFAAACLAPLDSGKRNRKGESHLVECLPAIASIDPAFAESLLRNLGAPQSARARQRIEDAKGSSVSALLPWPHFDGR